VIGGTAPSGAPRPSDPCRPPRVPDPPPTAASSAASPARRSDWAANEQVLIEDWCQQFPSHSTGSLAFGADEKLYISGGDGASFNNQDWGQFGGTIGTPPIVPKNPCGDPPVPVGGDQVKPFAEGGALRSQSPRRTLGEPRVLNGALLRVDPETGAALPDNPLFSSSDPNEQRIAAYGLRNPFRMMIKPGTNDVWIADVGWASWEELKRVPDLTSAPTSVGPSRAPMRTRA
jgi:glucose/arabinose dehydrogenase